MYKRKTNSKISFDVYRISDDTLAKSFEKEFDVDEIIFKNENEALELDGTLNRWADDVSKLKALEVAALEIGTEVPNDLTTTILYGATFRAENIEGYGINTFESGDTIEYIKKEIESYEKKRKQQLTIRQKAKQQADQKRKEIEEKQKYIVQKYKPITTETITTTIDNKPTTITTKHNLSTMDVIQVSRLYKSITTLERVKAEQEQHLQMYIDRIKEAEQTERYDQLLPAVKQRDKWQDEINMTNIKIERQNEAIKKLKEKGG